MRSSNQGILKVRLVEGEITKKNILGIKTYASLRLGSNVQDSSTIPGYSPLWSETFEFPQKDGSVLTVQVIEKGILSNQVIGQGVIGLRNLLEKGRECEKYPISWNNKMTGWVKLEIELIGPQNDTIPNDPPNMMRQKSDSGWVVNPPSRYEANVHRSGSQEVLYESPPLSGSQVNIPRFPQTPQMQPGIPLSPRRSQLQVQNQPTQQIDLRRQAPITPAIRANEINQLINTRPKSPISPRQQAQNGWPPQNARPQIPDSRRAPAPIPPSVNPPSSSIMEIITRGIKVSDINFEKLVYQSENQKVEIHLGVLKSLQNLKVAIKINYCENQEEFNYVIREVFIMKELDHPNICKVYATLLDHKGKYFNNLIVMENCEGGDLGKEIEERAKTGSFWEEEELIEIFKSLIEAFCQMQGKNIGHSDIKPPNFAFTKERKIKIIDFGIATHDTFRISTETTRTFKLGGTVPFFSPLQLEAYMGYIRGSNPNVIVRHNRFKSDVYSLGLTFFSMASLRQPTGLNDLSSNLEQRLSDEIYNIPYSEKLKRILRPMLTVDEKSRPDFIELYEIVSNLTNT
ncbi:unnamed protein product [Blepharisma stoltei]|uniref:Serine/threonine protein kinase n=1 Tax=Blepharisma stoltei TaxID=1481888 RepID=A0AAU9K7J1_9CILI|nr:unnamed protein product [Blepharisma stoltei]